ncbi:MAG: hypothetical protein L0211_05145 [Planctomycetaceae bacterium]|nr:hypothetical protein [Planctomycetaceae bacterium]
MRYLLGTDEAGYGPNLGPLVVAASAWELPDELDPHNLYDALAEVVCRTKSHAGDARLAIADSKQLYQAGGSLAALERGVLAMLSQLGRSVATWCDCWPTLQNHQPRPMVGALHCDPWHDGYDEPLPVAVTADELALCSAQLADGCRSRSVRLIELKADVLSPRRFNDELAECGNKAEVLSLTTLRLTRSLVADLPPGEVVVVCDKHGGRTHYAGLLQHVFDCELVRVCQETAELGIYEIQTSGRTIEFRFLVKGERMLPTALASMTAKYLRELAMRPLNAFWQRHVPGLRPTAGYPSDAARFYDDIRAARRRLKVDDRDLWRAK